jgi:hypothetical protein
MTVTAPESAVTEGVRTLEVRWILPGRLKTEVADWFGRFRARVETREDIYLLDPHLPGLSVKIRGIAALEVKVYRGSPGLLEVADRARGRVESWQKWSFPYEQPTQGQGSGGLAGWRPVHKRRRISSITPAGEPARTRSPGTAQARCEVELTEIRARGEAWWSLGFEVTGPADLLRGELDGTAALVFAQPLPGDAQLSTDDCSSYQDWLRRPPQHGIGTHTATR